jgi:hypothetical protein
VPAYQHTPERRKASTENESLGFNGLLSSEILLGQMSVLIGQDWASIAAANFLAAKELGLTELNLVRAVTEKNSIKEVQKMGEGFISSCFAKHRLLVWNYFPFLRARSQIGRRSAPLHDNSRFESAGFTIRREEGHDFVQRNLTID